MAGTGGIGEGSGRITDNHKQEEGCRCGYTEQPKGRNAMTLTLPLAIVAQLEALGAALQTCIHEQHGATLAKQEAAVLDAIRAALPGLLGVVVQLATADLAPGVAMVHRRCPRCERLVRMHGQRQRTVQTTCGSLTFARPWYSCSACHQGFSPADQTLALPPQARLSPALQAWLVAVGATTTYREAARLLQRLTGLTVASDTLRAHTTAVGEQVAAMEQTTIAQVQATREAAEPLDPAPGTLVVEADGAMVHYRDGWHEVKIGVVGGAQDEALLAPSYVAAREPAEQFGSRLLAEAARRGALEVVRWEGGVRGHGLAVLRPVHVVADGAPWIWAVAAEHFGERTEVVDFYHAAEHIWTVARAVYGADSVEARVGAQVCIRAMRAGGAPPVRAALAALHRETMAAAEVVRVERGYFTTNAGRMDYPAVAARGLPIGSGAVESGAKHVVQQRMKRPGQRWSERGARAMLALRARAASARPLMAAA